MYLAPFYNRVLTSPFKNYEKMERDWFGGPLLTDFKTDIQDKGDSFLLQADLPGFSKENIKVELNGDTMTIRAERHSEWEEDDKKSGYLRCERSFGSVQRSFDVHDIRKDGIKASYKDGVLSLTLPKKQEIIPERQVLEIED